MDSLLKKYLKLLTIKYSFFVLVCSILLFLLCPCTYTFVDIGFSIFFIIFNMVHDVRFYNISYMMMCICAFWNIFIFPVESMAVVTPIIILLIQMFKTRIIERVDKNCQNISPYIYMFMAIPWMFATLFTIVDPTTLYAPWVFTIAAAMNIAPNLILAELFLSCSYIVAISLALSLQVLDKAFKKIDSYQGYFDELTGLMNRKIISDWKDITSVPVVVFLDIDHFKRVNDTYGHDAGDAVLKKFTTVLKKKMPSDNILIREGGEEFVIVCKRFTNKFLTTLTSIMDYFRNNSFEYSGQRISFTISVGVKFNDSSLPLESLIKCADDSCYQAKNSGRNQMVIESKRVY